MVIDVLRATSVFTYATQSGVREVVPVLDIETARQLKAYYPPEEVLLGGERQGLPIDGFDLGNSPQHYTPKKVSGKTLIFTTTNGTVAMHAARFSRCIYIASFLNAAAVVECLYPENNIAILCAGRLGGEGEDDSLLAGCLTFRLLQRRSYQLNADANRVADLWQEPMETDELERRLRASGGGQALISLGLDADITVSAQIDTIDVVPRLTPAESVA